MKKEYLVQYKHNNFHPDTWFNASAHFNMKKRYLDTLEEALEVERKIKEEFPDCAHEIHQTAGYIGISSYVDTSTAHNLAVAETRIRVREVSEWEDVTDRVVTA